MTENIDPNDIEDCQKQVADLEAEVRELRAALAMYSKIDGDDGLASANRLLAACERGDGIDQHAAPDIMAARAEIVAQRAALERARAALERERMELVSASVSVSRARELTLAQEIRANNLSAALERARALLTDSHAYLTGKQSVSNPVRLVADITNFLQAAALGSGGAA